ncbi:winged helix-turn-helix domain-containing protein [Bradyrhizobium acaciae]|uniref:winged helix-turn-helix domain-containing protein n=1 Tax=Bradyrhizobium acaciae TaxID=2683706 RepID=UPI001E5C4CEF|nr:response regulator transcription factor [Bradyrhizobium acaciae]MCC8982142.1 response regulator transcription factor [Bradyrhizobium acaciae]
MAREGIWPPKNDHVGEFCARMVKPGILVVADDASLRATLARWLLRTGYVVELAESPRRANEVASKATISLAMIAPQGLGAPGVELVHELADLVEHLIMIGEPGDSAASGEPAVCISMPLNELDVLAKVRSVLRPAVAAKEPVSGPQILRFEGFTLDAAARTCVDAQGQDVTLTRAEFSLLLALAQSPGRVLSRDELTRVVTGRGAEPEDRSVDVLISRLRRKIEPDPKAPRFIVTVPGEGYRFSVKPQAVGTQDQAAAAQAMDVVQTADAPVVARDMQRPNRRPMFAAIAAAAVVLIMAVVGWKEWSNRGALQAVAEASPPGASPEARLPSKPTQPTPSREEQRAIVFKRMVTAMQDNQFNWRTVERLAILSGVDESEAHEILAEHPNEIVLGKSQEGKLLAKLVAR